MPWHSRTYSRTPPTRPFALLLNFPRSGHEYSEYVIRLSQCPSCLFDDYAIDAHLRQVQIPSIIRSSSRWTRIVQHVRMPSQKKKKKKSFD